MPHGPARKGREGSWAELGHVGKRQAEGEGKEKGERPRWALVPLGPKAGIGRFVVFVCFFVCFFNPNAILKPFQNILNHSEFLVKTTQYKKTYALT